MWPACLPPHYGSTIQCALLTVSSCHGMLQIEKKKWHEEPVLDVTESHKHIYEQDKEDHKDNADGMKNYRRMARKVRLQQASSVYYAYGTAAHASLAPGPPRTCASCLHAMPNTRMVIGSSWSFVQCNHPPHGPAVAAAAEGTSEC